MAELIVAMTVLAIISSFFIAKVLSDSETKKRGAVFKEVISLLQGIQLEGMNDRQLMPTTFRSYFFSRVNATKICSSNATTEGCWNTSTQGTLSYNKHSAAGFILPNGAAVVGFDNCCDNGNDHWHQQVVIDWNSTSPPNAWGEDIIYVTMCYGKGSCGPWSASSWQSIWHSDRKNGPGAIGPCSDTDKAGFDASLR